MTFFRKLLIGALTIGSVGMVLAGTFASFNATTTNPSNTFQTGTLVLKQGSSCYSTAPASQISITNTGACVTDLIGADEAVGGTNTSNAVTFTNVGSLGASHLYVWSTGCATGNGSDASSGNPTFNGAATDICSKINLTLASSSTCFYQSTSTGTGSSATPAPSAAPCGAVGSATGTLSNFAGTYPSGAAALDLGALGAGSSITLTIDTQLQNVDNSYQGLKGTIGLDWEIVQ